MIDKDSSVPLYLQIQTVLAEQIRTGEIAQGAQVPSELQIAAQYSVSRMTARKALDNLVSRGILYRRKGKGTYVAESRLTYGFSTMLSFSRTLRARGYTVDTRVLRTDVIPTTPDVTEKLELAPGSSVIIIRRLRVVEGTPAALHTAFLAYPQFAAVLDVDLSTESLLDTIKDVTGVSVAYTRDSVQSDLVSADDAPLLGIEPGSPVLKVEGVAYTENGQHTRYSQAVYRGDLFRLVLTNTGEQIAALKIERGALDDE
jgi:GntR family transcriptional regulator